MELLYNPQRADYKKSNSTQCPFCNKFNLSDDKKYEHLIVKTTDHSIIMLNMFPYNPGHLLVMPKAHISDISQLSEESRNDLFALLVIAMQAAKNVMHTEDMNVGINMGKTSGGSVQSHVHIHIVPRFIGDTNFLAVIAETKVVTKDIRTIYDLYKEYFNGL